MVHGKQQLVRLTDYWDAPLHIRLRRLRWVAPVAVLILAALHQAGLHLIVDALSESWHQEAELLIYGFTGSIVAWIGLSRIATSIAAHAEAEKQTLLAYAELESNHQKLLTLNEIGRQLGAANDEQTVLELAARAPHHLTGAQASTVVTFADDKDRLKLDMAWGLSDAYLQAFRARLATGISANRCRECSVLKTVATSDCPLFEGLHEKARADGIGGLICLPMVYEQERVGLISAYFPSVDGPPEDQIHLLNILSGVIASMLESLRARTRQTDALYALDQVLQTGDTGVPIMRDFEDQVLFITTAGWEAQVGGLFLFDQETQTWACRARQGLGDNLTDPRFSLALELATQAHATGSAVISPDLAKEAGYDFLSAVAAPLIAEGQTLGAIFLGAKRKRAFDSRHVELLNTMAHQIALAIRNAQLYVQLDQLAVLKERYRLSREIHDGLAQTLALLNMQTERLENLIQAGKNEAAAREVDEMRHSIQSAYLEAREAIEGLRQELDRPDQMASRLAEYSAQFSQKTGIQTHLTIDPEGLLVEPSVALQLFRIVQESMANVRKHARANRVEVSLKATESELELSITDNGRGFPDAMQPDLAAQRHFGMTTMRERARNLGGALTVATGVNQGTRITVAVPLSDNKRVVV